MCIWKAVFPKGESSGLKLSSMTASLCDGSETLKLFKTLRKWDIEAGKEGWSPCSKLWATTEPQVVLVLCYFCWFFFFFPFLFSSLPSSNIAVILRFSPGFSGGCLMCAYWCWALCSGPHHSFLLPSKFVKAVTCSQYLPGNRKPVR